MKRSFWIVVVTANAVLTLFLLIGFSATTAVAKTERLMKTKTAVVTKTPKQLFDTPSLLPPQASISLNTMPYGQPAEGNHFAYRIDYNNFGGSPADNTTIDDNLPIGMAYLSHTAPFPINVIPTGSGIQLSWNLGTLSAGESGFFDVYVGITESVGTILTRTLLMTTTSSNMSMPNDYNVVAVEMVMSNDSNVTIQDLYAWVDDPAPDTAYVYALETCNSGNVTSAGVTVDFTAPEGTMVTDWLGLSPGWYSPVVSDNVLSLNRYTIGSWGCDKLLVTVDLGSGPTPGTLLTATAVVTSPTDIFGGDNGMQRVNVVGDPHYDLAIKKNWTAGGLYPNGWINYRIEYENNGNVPLDNLLITDVVPAGTVYGFAQQNSYTGTIAFTPIVNNGSELVWAIDRLESGEYADFLLFMNILTATAPYTTLTNTVEFGPIANEETYLNNEGMVVETIYPIGPNLRVVQSGYWHDNNPRLIDIHVGIENVGTTPFMNFTVTNTTPISWMVSNLQTEFWRGTVTLSGSNFFTAVYSYINPGESIFLNFTLELTDSITIPATVDNMIVATMFPTETHLADNTTSLTLFPPPPDLYVAKFIQACCGFGPNNIYTYTIDYGNVGGSDATNVLLTDTLPANLSFVSASQTPDMINGSSYSWDLDTVAVGVDKSLVMTVAQVGPYHVPITNVAVIIGNNGDSFLDNNMVAHVLEPIANVDVMKFAPSTQTVGDQFDYFLMVTNVGPDKATDVVVNDILPAEVSFVSATSVTGVNCNYDSQLTLVSCTTPVLTDSHTFPITITVDAVAEGVAVNTADAYGAQYDPDILNNVISVTTTIGGGLADLQMIMNGPSAAILGDTFMYMLDVYNEGPDGAANVSMVNNLPNNVSFVDVDASAGVSCANSGVLGELVECDASFLGIGEGFFVTVTVHADTLGLAFNTAVVTSDMPDPVLPNNSDFVSTTIALDATNLTISKTVDLAYANVGDTLTYQITAMNEGAGLVAGVVITDYFPYLDVALESVTTDAGVNCGPADVDGEPVISCLTDLAGGESKQITVTAVVSYPVVLYNAVVIDGGGIDVTPFDNEAFAVTFAFDQNGPYIFDIYPPSGINTQETIIEIYGFNFTPDSVVALSGTLPLSTTFYDEDYLEAVVPASLPRGAYDIVVIDSDLSHTFYEPFYVYGVGDSPLLEEIYPDFGVSSLPNIIEVYGDNFIPGMSGGLVPISAKGEATGGFIELLELFFITPDYMWAIVPANVPEGLYNFVVGTPDGQSATLPEAYFSFEGTGEDLFAIENDLWTDPASPVVGISSTIGLYVRRFSALTSTITVTVDFYDTNPVDGTGELIGRETISGFDLYDVYGEALVSTTWTATRPGLHTIYAVIDPDDEVVEDFEDNNVVSYTLRVRATGGGTAPVINTFTINNGAIRTTDPNILCNVDATIPTRFGGGDGTPAYILYVDFVFRQNVGDWVAVKDSGWRNYDEASTNFVWPLSPNTGAHYVLVLVADAYGNVSEVPGEQFINVFPMGNAFIAQGQGHIFRWQSEQTVNLKVRLTNQTGNADLHVWNDNDALIGFSEKTTPVDQVSFTAEAGRLYQIEINGIATGLYRLEVMETTETVVNQIFRPRPAPFFGVGKTPDGNVGLPPVPEGGSLIFLPTMFNN